MKQVYDKNFPQFYELIHPIFRALKTLGGSGSNSEILEQVIKDLKLPDHIVNTTHLGNENMSELMYRSHWAKTYMKKYGIIENSARAVWSIKPDYTDKDIPDAKSIVKAVSKPKEIMRDDIGVQHIEDMQDTNDADMPDELKPWREKLADILKTMDPYGFERLAQRVLRECGFTQVEVTKKSADGGIDGTGKLRINGIFSFNVAFQCKRYAGQVGAAEIRDFRGSLTTDIEKGVMITTGTFSKAAKEEASNPGKQQIDLIDGEDFISKIAEYGIGVKPVTIYEIDEDFFKKI